MEKLFSALKIILVQLMMLSIISGMTGCSSGGHSDPPAAATTPGTTTITGRVVDGVIAGATVRAYQINADGTKGNAIGKTATTDANGNYSLSLSNEAGTAPYTGPVLVESAGGSYTDWASGDTVVLGSADTLSAVISIAKNPITINITPLTYVAVLLALQDIAVNNDDIPTAIDTANSMIGEYLGGIDIVQDAPIDPTVSGSSIGASQNSIDYAMILAGISQAADDRTLNPFSLSVELAKDASDGVLDGKQGTTQLTVANASGVGRTNLTASAAKGDLSANITTFQNNLAKNKSGGTIRSGTLASLSSPLNSGIWQGPYKTFFSSIRTDASRLYFKTVNPGQVGNYAWLTVPPNSSLSLVAMHAYQTGREVAVWVAYPFITMPGDGSQAATIRSIEIILN